jgi:hypothetical protein
METIKGGLTKRIVELAVSEKKLMTDKKKLRERLIEKGLLAADTKGTSAWNGSVAADISQDLLNEEEKAQLAAIEETQRSMTAGFANADESGDGELTRGELELQFGRLQDAEWEAFDPDGVSDTVPTGL